MKAILLRVLTIVALVLAGAAGAQEQTWQCGANITATLSSPYGGTLTISGTGEVEGGCSQRVRNSTIRSVVIEDGVTSIENAAFEYFQSLTSVTIGNSVISIGNGAFRECTRLTSVTIPNSVTSIAYGAFERCTGLTSVTIPNSVTSIGIGAFRECTGLTSVTIGSGVTSIGWDAFSNCTGLTSVISLRVTPPAVEYSPFYNDEGNGNYVHTSACLYVPQTAISAYRSADGWSDFSCINTVTAVITFDPQGGSAVKPQYNLSGGNVKAAIPADPARSGYSFGGWHKDAACTELWNFDTDVVSSDTTLYAKWYPADETLSWDCGEIPGTVRAVLRIADGTLTISGSGKMADYYSTWDYINSRYIYAPWYYSNDSITSVVIEDGVTSIGNYAFSGIGLTSVTIPSGVTSIGDGAFSGLKSITSLSAIPPTISDAAFYAGCLLVPEEYIGVYGSANGWKDFSCIQKIGQWTQTWDCGATPGTVTATLGEDGTLTVSGTGAMKNYSWNIIQDIPWKDFSGFITDVVIEDGVTSIGESAFSGYGLTSVTIPNSVTSIGHRAFENCSGLTSLTIPNSVTSIGDRAFGGCDNLRSIVSLRNVPPAIGEDTFNRWNVCLFVPKAAVTAYGSAVGWKELSCIQVWEGLPRTWDCGKIPGTVTATLDEGGTLTISGAGAMADYPINEQTGLSNAPWYGFRGLFNNAVISDGVTSIGERAFLYYVNLRSVTIGDSVKSIGKMAFNGCTGLTSVTIPDGVTSIGDGAFYYCTGLTSVTIPNSVTSIGGGAYSRDGGAFSRCTSLTSVTIGNSVTTIAYSAFRECKSLTSVTIPNSVDSIGGSAFSDCIGLTSITIPNSVTSIGEGAFSRSGLTSVTIPNSVTSIGSAAFSACSSLTSIDVGDGNPAYSSVGGVVFSKDRKTLHIYPAGKQGAYTIPNGVTFIGQSAFSGCAKLTSVTIPDGVTSIGNSAFYNCTGLTSVTIPDGVTTIGGAAFRGCAGLTSVTIPDDVTSIESETFDGCTNLTSVTIPNSVASIGWGAFRGCVRLMDMMLPNGVTSIEQYAFSGCTGLIEVTIPNGVTSIGKEAFRGCTGMRGILSLNVIPPAVGENAFSTGGGAGMGRRNRRIPL